MRVSVQIACGLRAIRTLLLTLSVALAIGSTTARAQPVPVYQGLVNDQAQILPHASRAYLTYMLKQYEARTGHQLAFLSVDSLGGFTPEVYALKVAQTWKLGRARPDDGLLLLVAKQDHKVRIEVGYGLEGTIPDATANRIIDEVITPAFRRDQFAWGLLVAFKTLMRHADEAATEPMVDPLAVLLEIEAPVVKSYLNDHAQLLDSTETQRLNAKLTRLAAESGFTFAVLTVRCPGQLSLEPCVDAVNELWSGPINAYFDGLVTWFVHAPSGTGAADAGMETARLTLDRLAAPSKQAWRKGAIDQHAELESALRDLVQRAGLIWSAPSAPQQVAYFPQSVAAGRRHSSTLEEVLTFGVVAFVLLGGLGLMYLMHRHSTPYQRSADDDRDERKRTESRDSSPGPYYASGGGGWSSSGGSSSDGGDNSGGGGGSFGGGGASGSW